MTINKAFDDLVMFARRILGDVQAKSMWKLSVKKEVDDDFEWIHKTGERFQNDPESVLFLGSSRVVAVSVGTAIKVSKTLKGERDLSVTAYAVWANTGDGCLHMMSVVYRGGEALAEAVRLAIIDEAKYFQI